jgi:hypothetical protein
MGGGSRNLVVFAEPLDTEEGIPLLAPNLLEASNYRSQYRDIGDDVRL